MTGAIDSDSGGSPHPFPRRLQTAAHSPLECSAARAKLVGCLARWGCERADDIVLVFSELVTNAVLHAGGAERITVDPAGHGSQVRIEVHDNVSVDPRPCPPGPHGGFGLGIIERLSEAWGTTPTDTGKVVWAVVPTTLPVGRAQRAQA